MVSYDSKTFTSAQMKNVLWLVFLNDSPIFDGLKNVLENLGIPKV